MKSKLFLVGLVVLFLAGIATTYSLVTASDSDIAKSELSITKGEKADLAVLKCGEGEDDEKKCGEGDDEKKCGEGDDEEKCGEGDDEEKCGEGKCGDESDDEEE